ncbi:IclR family transcriptional regulator [Halodurantibacterium flavum]|uniref:IclR family transcriptional regulator n=1 Tax=Halodurantibacterium flavum TaxID=1382802 RepID=A0ABW4S0B2_9RHOB
MNELRWKPSSPAIARAVLILDAVAEAPDNLTMADLARKTGLPRSSVHGVCSTMVEAGLLLRNADQTYAIGPHVMRWATSFTRRSDIATEFARIWDESTVELRGATITLAVPDGNDIVYIAVRNSSKTPWYTYRVGMRLPMAFTSTGHAFLTKASNSDIINRFRDGFPEPLTAKSPRSVKELIALIDEARARGYTQDREYVSDGKVCYGAPILGVANNVIASIAVSVPVEELTEEFEANVIQTVQRLALLTSERMGAEIEVRSNTLPRLTSAGDD